jgi:hypothetical protein
MENGYEIRNRAGSVKTGASKSAKYKLIESAVKRVVFLGTGCHI